MRGIRSLFEASRPKGPSDDDDDLTSHGRVIKRFPFTPVPTFGIFYLLKIKPFSSFRQNIMNSMIDGYNTVTNS